MTSLDGRWRLVEMRGSGTVDAGSAPTIEISGADFSGNAGVNRFFGKFEDGSVVSPIGTTMMAGPAHLMDLERDFLGLIGKASSWSVGEGRLTVEAGAISAVFEPAADRLEGVVWELSGYNNGTGGFTTPVPGSSITAKFDIEGFVSGTGGCNRYRAEYEVDEGKISVGPVMATRMACPDDESSAQEQRYFALLESADRVGFATERGHEFVDLFDEADLLLVRFIGPEPDRTGNIE
jgi:heat shock protein HslJ